MKPEDDNQKSLVSEAVEAVYGSKADKVVVSSEDKARSSGAEEEYAHGEELASGKWLRLTIFRNPRTGSASYRVSGQLPLYEGKPRPDLLDRQNRPVLIPGEVPRSLRDNYPTDGVSGGMEMR